MIPCVPKLNLSALPSPSAEDSKQSRDQLSSARNFTNLKSITATDI